MSTKAKEHIVLLDRSIDEEEYYIPNKIQALANEINEKILSGQLTINGKPGDVVRVMGLDNEGYSGNDGIYMFDGTILIPLDYTIDENGHVPEEFYWPEYPVDHWVNVIQHGNLIPIRFNEAYDFTDDLVEAAHVRDPYDVIVEVPVIETEEFLIVYPSQEDLDADEIAEKMMHARHVEVILPQVKDIPYINVGWHAEREDFLTDKTILVIIPDNMYNE